jgi:hypothetical protein
MVGPDPALFYFFLIFVKRKIQKYLFVILQVSAYFFMSFLLISSNIFYVAKNTKSDIKISGFGQNF